MAKVGVVKMIIKKLLRLLALLCLCVLDYLSIGFQRVEKPKKTPIIKKHNKKHNPLVGEHCVGEYSQVPILDHRSCRELPEGIERECRQAVQEAEDSFFNSYRWTLLRVGLSAIFAGILAVPLCGK